MFNLVEIKFNRTDSVRARCDKIIGVFEELFDRLTHRTENILNDRTG